MTRFEEQSLWLSATTLATVLQQLVPRPDPRTVEALSRITSQLSDSARIIDHGLVLVPDSVRDQAEAIKLENYKIQSPASMEIHSMAGLNAFAADLCRAVGSYKGSKLQPEDLNVVFFSCCSGAREHTDLLDPTKFHPTTYVIPVILPKVGRAVITAESEARVVELNHVYEFNHEQPHSMLLEDAESGCVVMMAAVRR